MAGKWLWPWDRVLCPFCFQKFHLGDAPLRPLDGTSDDMAPDEVIHRRLGNPAGEAPVLPRCIPPRPQDDKAYHFQYLWSRVRLDNSSMRRHDRVCPECHCALPLAIAKGDLKGNVIAIIGEKSAGKSNYFASLIHQLKQGINLEGSGITLMSEATMDPKSFKKQSSNDLWSERYGRYILGENLDGRDRRAVPQSQSWATNPDVRTPLIYRLMFDNRHRSWTHRLTQPGSQFRALDLIIYDTAGEDLEKPENANRWLPFLTQANGLIFLVDPRAIPAVGFHSASVNGGGRGVDSGNHNATSRAGKVIDHTLELFERHGHQTAERFTAKPTAFVLTKSDILKPPQVESGTRIPNEAEHTDGVDLEDLERVSQEVQSYLVRSKETALLDKMMKFPRKQFFAVSALGEEPSKVGADQFEIKKLRPRRVLDPLLWMLNQFGYLAARDENR